MGFLGFFGFRAQHAKRDQSIQHGAVMFFRYRYRIDLWVQRAHRFACSHNTLNGEIRLDVFDRSLTLRYLGQQELEKDKKCRSDSYHGVNAPFDRLVAAAFDQTADRHHPSVQHIQQDRGRRRGDHNGIK